MNDQSGRWADVATAVRARMRDLGISQAELRRRSNISDKTLVAYLDGAPIKREDKRYDLARALSWTPDSIDRIAAGEPPVEAGGLYLTESEAEELQDSLSKVGQLAEAIDRLLATTEAMRERIRELEAQQAEGSSGRGDSPR